MQDGKQYPVSCVYLIPFSNIIGFVTNFGTYFNKVELFMENGIRLKSLDFRSDSGVMLNTLDPRTRLC
jgi:hypothetical protein